MIKSFRLSPHLFYQLLATGYWLLHCIFHATEAGFRITLICFHIAAIGGVMLLITVVSAAANHPKILTGFGRRLVQISRVKGDFTGGPFPDVADHIERTSWTFATGIFPDIGNACRLNIGVRFIPFISPGIFPAIAPACSSLP